MATEILSRIDGKQEVEFISEVAAELPIQMLAELFGIDQEARYKLFEWSNIIIGGDDPDIVVSPEQVRGALMELAEFAMQMHEQRKKEPGSECKTGQFNDRAIAVQSLNYGQATRHNIHQGTIPPHPCEYEKMLGEGQG